ncbi:MAG: Uma2 family endonuclease [Rhodothermales bacterium]
MAELLRNTRIMTRAEYLAFEEEAKAKHEFYAFPDSGDDLGLVVAMAGASLAHNQIVSNLAFGLRRHLHDRDCRVLTSDLRVQAGNRYYYPDVVALCDEPAIEPDVRPDTLVNPLVLVEVASSSTSEVDRGKKLRAYAQLESLREYWMVEQDEPVITHATRSGDGWEVRFVRGLEGTLESPALDVVLPMADVYVLVDFPKPERE